ncbi:16S rRNA (cytidine(1402)-2'-O)-methyltransferase [Pseudoroseicyclus tamaricis]|uniref:Ribosomal RNA small subunit methyltransferase I n=1 Tax=Pseudoroseicyclus tamaricis TaxID=2705421 RepID=A0A6B2JPS5_9RHOB|nr:16S rRNA (cytidine(1402)-2'-O)-methyltransferase [Pseudoroseicyclus tamaricis]NDV00108.1 16S rRNA (cytidine(1402)-2'-O)-methyltransferase [Pseudoroseicyclus tamaricis]
MKSGEQPVPPGLHLVSTPIGAAADITLKGLDLLARADALAAEDTRTARRLMDIHGVALGHRRLTAYHDHSGPETRARLLAPLEQGGSLAYVSEAGTPLVSDPGFALVRDAVARGIPVHAAPGASAVLAALAVAGLPTDRFTFLGFLPPGAEQRRTALAELKAHPFTMVLYESPRRVREMFTDLVNILGDERPAALCRELTKRFEEVRRGSLAELAEGLVDEPRGEIVVVIGGAPAGAGGSEELEEALRSAMETMRVKDAATAVAGALGLPRRQVYQAALELEKNR